MPSTTTIFGLAEGCERDQSFKVELQLFRSEMAQYLNVEKWGWDFPTLSGEVMKVEKNFSP